ncbi:MAG: DUF4286 family protein [Flavipsychrobacter sp.]
MFVYNVTVKVENRSAEEWVKWMKEEHMPALVKTGLFTDSRLFRLLEQDEAEGITYVAQYFCNNMDDYNAYISKHAQEMRDWSFRRFGNKFIAFRTLMQVES